MSHDGNPLTLGLLQDPELLTDDALDGVYQLWRFDYAHGTAYEAVISLDAEAGDVEAVTALLPVGAVWTGTTQDDALRTRTTRVFVFGEAPTIPAQRSHTVQGVDWTPPDRV